MQYLLVNTIIYLARDLILSLDKAGRKKTPLLNYGFKSNNNFKNNLK